MDKRPKTVKLRLAAAAAVDVRSMTVTLDVIYYYAGAVLRIERDCEDKKHHQFHKIVVVLGLVSHLNQLITSCNPIFRDIITKQQPPHLNYIFESTHLTAGEVEVFRKLYSGAHLLHTTKEISQIKLANYSAEQ